MSRIDNTFTPGTLFEESVERIPLRIEEGLIKSYPIERVAESIASLFNLQYNGKVNALNPIRGITTTNGEIRITSENGADKIISVEVTNEDIIEDMDRHFLKYGWFNFRTDGNVHKYERKFGDRFSAKQLLNVTNRLYHIMPSTLIGKVTTQGLVPKSSKTYGFSNEERIYLSVYEPSADDVNDFKLMKGDWNKDYSAVEVHVDKIPETQSFFFDPRWPDSVFTFEPIPSSAIKIVEIK